MEFFGSHDETPTRASLDQLDTADVYVGIIGSRYGAGITEQEYSRARQRGLPAFIYLKTDSDDSKTITEDVEDRLRLGAFRLRLLQDHTCSQFATADDLAVRLVADLHNWMFERHLARGLASLATDYRSRVQAFLSVYLGGRDRHVPFGGRAREMCELDDWLNDAEAPRFMLVTAGAGKGKSALLVRWTRTLLARDDVAPVFFPISIRFRTNLASVVFPCLATSVAALHNEPLKTTPDTPPEVWRGLLTDLMARPLPGGRRLVLVVDGLDEAADWSAGSDLFPPHIARHARVVVASRFLAGDVNADDWLRRLGWDNAVTARTLTLAPLQVPGVAEVLDRMGFPLATLGDRSDIVHELHRLSQGEPLVVHLYVNDLWKRGEAATRLRVEDLRNIEPGLAGYFERWWADQKELWGSAHPLREQRVQALMNFLACALGPLTRDDLFAVAGPMVDLNTWTLEDALEPLQRFIVGDGVENGYAYSHPGLAIYFRERLSRRERDSLDNRITEWCAAWVEAIDKGQRRAEECSAYVLQYFGAHLERGSASLSQFAPLLTDAWRRAWHAYDGTYAGYRADLRRVHLVATRLAGANTGDRAPAFALQLRAALCIGSVDQLTDNTPPELVVALVERGVWSRVGAVGYARLIRNPERRAKALTYLVSVVPASSQPQIGREALDAIALVRDDAKLPLFEGLGSLLPNSLVGDAVDLALAISKHGTKAAAIVALAPRLTPWHVERVLKVVCSLADMDVRRRLFLALAAAHPTICEAWISKEENLDDWEHAWILIGVADGLGLPKGMSALDRAASVAARVNNDVARLDLLVSVLERVSPSERRLRVDRVLREVSKCSYPQTRATMLSRLSAIADSTNATNISGLALEECARVSSDSARGEILAALAPNVAPPHQSAAFALIEAIKDAGIRARAAAALFPHLPTTLQASALQLILEVEDPFECLCALEPIGEIVPIAALEAQTGELESEMLSPSWRFRLVRMLAPRVGDRLRTPNLWGLDELATCAALARSCTPPRRHDVDARVVRVVSSTRNGYPFDDVLGEALEFLEYWASDAGEASLARVVDAVLNWETSPSRIAAIDRLAPCLSVHLLEQVLRRLQTIGDEGVRRDTQMQCLALLGPSVVNGSLAPLWDRARAADRISAAFYWWRAGIGHTATLRADVVARLSAVDSEPRRAEAIAEFMRLAGTTVTVDEMTVLISAAVSLTDSVLRASTLSWLVPHLQDTHQTRFAEIVNAMIADSTEAAGAAATVAARMPSDEFLDLFGSLCSAEMGSETWDFYRSSPLFGLVRLARALPEPLRTAATDRMLESLESVDKHRRCDLLIHIARRLDLDDDEFFARCLALSRTLGGVNRISSGVALAARVDRSSRADAITDLIGYAEQLDHADKARAFADALQDTPADVAAKGLWKAGLVLAFGSSLPAQRVAELIPLACAELRAQQPHEFTTRVALGLLRKATTELQDPLVEIALEGLHQLPGALRADALRDLDAAVSGNELERAPAPMSALAPFLEGPHLDRYETLFATQSANSTAAECIASLGLHLSPRSFLEFVDHACPKRDEQSATSFEAAHSTARLARLAAARDEPTRRESAHRIASAIGKIDRSPRLKLLNVFSGLDSGDVVNQEYWTQLVGDVDPLLRFRLGLRFLLKQTAVTAITAVHQLMSWIDELPARERSEALPADADGLALKLATADAWRAALVLVWLSGDSHRGRDTAGALAELAFADVDAHAPQHCATVATALLPIASDRLIDRFCDLALIDIHAIPNPSVRASALADLVVHIPRASFARLVPETVSLLAADGARAGESVVVLLRTLLPHVTTEHADRLWHEMVKATPTDSIVGVFVDQLPDNAIEVLSADVLAAIAQVAEPERMAMLGRWIGRLPPPALDRLLVDTRQIQSPSFVALALANAIPRLAPGKREALKSAAAANATSAIDVDWDTLLMMREAASDEPWPALTTLIIQALRREPSAQARLNKAATIFFTLSDPGRRDVLATVIDTLSTLPPEGTDIRGASRQMPAEELLHLVQMLLGAWGSPEKRDALLLPLVPAAQKRALVERMTQTNQWMNDSPLFDAVASAAIDPAVALYLADRALDYPLTNAGARERILQLWSCVPANSAAWHALSVNLLFTAAAESRASVMRVFQQMLPAVHRSLGLAQLAEIVESMEAVGEWWP